MGSLSSIRYWKKIAAVIACAAGIIVTEQSQTREPAQVISSDRETSEPRLQPTPAPHLAKLPGPTYPSVRDRNLRPVAFLLESSEEIEISVESVVLTSHEEAKRGLRQEARKTSDPLIINGDYRSGSVKITFSVEHPTSGKLDIRFGGAGVHDTRDIADTIEVKIDVSQLAGRGTPQELTWEFTAGDNVTADEETEKPHGKIVDNSLLVDLEGPRLRAPNVVEFDEAKTVVDLHFRDDDLDEKSAETVGNYHVERFTEHGNFEAAQGPDDAKIRENDTHVVRLTFNERLKDGVYRVTLPASPVSETDTEKRPLQDIAGNHIGGTGTEGETVEAIFGLNPAPKEAKHVEFPEFLPTAPQPTQHRRINAGDKVETRVLRLFYFRDAHRVAQLINRTAESLNQQAVTLAERRAANARTQADDLTDERRAQERKAVRAAEELRRAQNQLQQYQQVYREEADELQRLETERKGLLAEIQKVYDERQERAAEIPEAPLPPVTRDGSLRGDAPEPADDPKLRQHDKQLIAQAEELERINTAITDQQEPTDQLARTVTTQRNAVDDLRKTAAEENEDAQVAEAKEDRAHEKQFRLEVAAAHEEPDTFAAAEKNSVDPVAQCSVSVIGEGLLQVRGPRKGIDKIRTMVHQIDMPLGQVKVEVVTVQLNGERGERMERPLGRVEAQINMGRFLTSQSLMMLRQAIVAEASMVAEEVDMGGHYQEDRDRKYLYAFFGRDFIDELYEMDSEFLRSENKVLSLHSMDTVGLHQATFILALARNDVRQRILARFMEMVKTNLVQAEFDFRRTSELKPHKTWPWLPHHSHEHHENAIYEAVCLNNQQRYHFRNLLTFFGQMEGQLAGTMNPMQREFIRLAQIFKSRLVAEMELKQRVIERTMIEDERERDLQAEEAAANSIRTRLLVFTEEVQNARFEASKELGTAINEATRALGPLLSRADTLRAQSLRAAKQARQAEIQWRPIKQAVKQAVAKKRGNEATDGIKSFSDTAGKIEKLHRLTREAHEDIVNMRKELEMISPLYPETIDKRDIVDDLRTILKESEEYLDDVGDAPTPQNLRQLDALLNFVDARAEYYYKLEEATKEALSFYRSLKQTIDEFFEASRPANFNMDVVVARRAVLVGMLEAIPSEDDRATIGVGINAVLTAATELNHALRSRADAQSFLEETRRSLGQRKLLDFLIEEQEEKVADLREGTRAHLARMDDYLKRMMIALEDDFNMQYYDPAFVRIRSAAREWDVTLGQVERTSILTNNRAFAKVTPQATMEFDLPKRKVAVVEAFDAAQALVQDYGAMMNDPTFLAAAELMGAGPPNGLVRKVYPSLPNAGDEQQMQYSDLPPKESGSALEQLVPDPSIYKFETGTGYEIRPVIQPDGYSIVYDFNYMYTTNVREPVQADEKHLGRIKRHFIDTQVQTGSFEMREVSRYQVALKAARTAQGVPMLQDIPILGLAFRPLPSAESSIQQNVILARSVVYPTVFDVMGLRWAPSVVDLSHESLRDQEHVTRGRHRAITDAVYDRTSKRVDSMLGIGVGDDVSQREDLYRRQRKPSPYHPGGYTHREMTPEDDPTGRGFEHEDDRPTEMRQPPYDPRFRRPIRYENIPGTAQPSRGESIERSPGAQRSSVGEVIDMSPLAQPSDPGEVIDMGLRAQPSGPRASVPTHGARIQPDRHEFQHHTDEFMFEDRTDEGIIQHADRPVLNPPE